MPSAGTQLFSAPDKVNFDAKVFTHHRQVLQHKYLTTTTLAQHLLPTYLVMPCYVANRYSISGTF